MALPRVLILLLAITALAAPGLAQPVSRAAEPGSTNPPAPAQPEFHGWMTIRDDRDQSTVLIHLPPRTIAGDAWGTTRIAPSVARPTEAVAAHADRAWLALDPERGPGGHFRRVVTLSATRSLGGAWDYPPGRPEVLPPLDGTPQLIGFVGTSVGPVALLRGRRGAPSDTTPAPPAPPALGEDDWALVMLAGVAWRAVALPWDAADAPGTTDTVRLVGMGASVGILVATPDADAATLFKAELPSAAALAGESPEPLSWSSSSYPLEGARAGTGLAFAPDAVFLVTDGRSEHLVAASWLGGDELEIVSLRRGGASVLARVEGVPRDHRLAPMNGTASLAVLWWVVNGKAGVREPPPGSTASRHFQLVEVSCLSGKELYRGPAKTSGLISTGEFQALAIGLLLVTTVILLLALRAEPTADFALPRGFAVAGPFARLIAAMADLVPGVVIAAFAVGISPEAMLSPTIFIGPRAEPAAWLLALLFTMLHCTIGEATSGRSLGKALAGCEVVAIRRTGPEPDALELGRVQLWQAVVRNLIRWSLPPLGILLLLDTGRRHPADAAARTLVVTRIPEPDAE